jgi:Methane oxygenase PmoA
LANQILEIPMFGRLEIPLSCFLLIAFSLPIQAQVPLPTAKPVPRMQVLPLPHDEASIERDGREIARYHFSPQDRRPFLYPVIGPSGKSLTRMGHPRDPVGHSHHNSVWVAHHDVGGVSFWGDTGKGRIVQKKIRYEDADNETLLEAENAWNDETGKTLLQEVRTLRFRPQADSQWLLVIDLVFTADSPVTLGKTSFGPVAVRLAKTIGVHDGGGTIRNSAGGVNEKEVFWKPAKWVDYSGPMPQGVIEGITLMDHPSNPNHPNAYHVRDDGWMGACTTFAADRVIDKDKPLSLRYGLWVHGGLPSAELLNAQFDIFSKIESPPAKKN